MEKNVPNHQPAYQIPNGTQEISQEYPWSIIDSLQTLLFSAGE
jgi:hypothetical protein